MRDGDPYDEKGSRSMTSQDLLKCVKCKTVYNDEDETLSEVADTIYNDIVVEIEELFTFQLIKLSNEKPRDYKKYNVLKEFQDAVKLRLNAKVLPPNYQIEINQ